MSVSPREDHSVANQIVRVFHTAAADGQIKAVVDDGATVNVSMFKTVKINSVTTVGEVITTLVNKLKMPSPEKYHLYSINTEYNFVKRRIESSEIIQELITSDVMNKLKLGLLHETEAKRLTKLDDTVIQFYQWTNKVITGPFPVVKDDEWATNDVLKHRKLLNSEFYPMMNLTLNIGEFRILSLRAIIEVRCPSLLTAVNIIKKKKEKKGDFLGPLKITYKEGMVLNKFVLVQILDWCYTGTLPFHDLKLTDILVMLYAAQQLCIPHLGFICEQYIRNELNVETVFVILKQAVLLKMDDMKDLAIEFAHSKWGQLVTNREGMELIGMELFQELTVTMATKQSSNIPDLALVKNSFLEDFELIYKNAMFTDGEAVFGNDDPPVKFHRAIVSAYSKPLFALITSTQFKGKPVLFEGLNEIAFRDMLQYIYFGRTQLHPLGSCRIIEFAHSQLSLRGLFDHALNSIAGGITVQSALPILRITYLPQAKHRTTIKIREVLLQFICEHFDEIDMLTLRTLEPVIERGYSMVADVLDALYLHRNPSRKGANSNRATVAFPADVLVASHSLSSISIMHSAGLSPEPKSTRSFDNDSSDKKRKNFRSTSKTSLDQISSESSKEGGEKKKERTKKSPRETKRKPFKSESSEKSTSEHSS